MSRTPNNMQQHLSLLQNQINTMQQQLNTMQTNINELFKIINVRTEDIIMREHKLQNDINDMKLFLKTRLGAPDSSRLKDLMKIRLANERFDYRN
jgi:peptidoglycan hydrolase CwlO-like protein